MKKAAGRHFVLLFFLAFFMGLAGPAQAQGDKILWKVGTLAPKGIGWANQVSHILVPAVEKASDGNVVLKVYWGGVMGDDREILDRMQKGRLQVGGLSALGATLACPEMSILQLPFLFNDYKEVDHIRNSLYPDFEAHMAKNGLHLWIWVDQDFDKVFTVNRKLLGLADFKGLRFATWHPSLEDRVFTHLGALAINTKIPEIPGVVKSGRADALLAPCIWMVGAQMHSAVRFASPISIRYSPSVINVSQKAWDALPLEYKKRATAMREQVTREFNRAVRQDNKKYFDAMIQYGIQMVDMAPHDVRDLKLATKPVGEELAGSLYPARLLERIQGLLKQYRSRNP